METSLFEITLSEGRKFRIFCANKSQKKRFMKTLSEVKSENMIVASNGIHAIKQWEEIIKFE